MTDTGATPVPPADSPWLRRGLFGALCAVVIGIYIWSAGPGLLESGPDDGYYNLLVQGFQAGHLNLNRQPDPHLAQLANPYAPALNSAFVKNAHYLSFELSYYHGKLYLYFGVTPALVLFWPYAAVTGHYLSQTAAVVIFCALGFLVAACLIYQAWRRYFPLVNVLVPAAGMLAIGLATGLPGLLASCDVYQVAISCAFAFTMLALFALWHALHEPERKGRWLLLASLAYGLAIGARPSLLFGAIMLLVPVLQAWRARPEQGPRFQPFLLAPAAGPLMIIGLGLMLYNWLRFGSPFEFGWHYMLTELQNSGCRQFDLHYLWFNFRFYFLHPAHWVRQFPFIDMSEMAGAPAGYGGVGVERFGGILTDDPIAWLALAVPLAWPVQAFKKFAALRWFLIAASLQFAACAGLLCLFLSASNRYEVDFLPAFMLLAVMGIFLLETALAGKSFWRGIARVVWGLLLAYSIVFNLLTSLGARATDDCFAGNHLINLGEVNQAIVYYQKALKLNPHYAEAYDGFGNALVQKGQTANAIACFERAMALKPNLTETYYNLGDCFLNQGRVQDAIEQNQIALKLNPDFAKAHNGLASCYLQQGRMDEAIGEFEKTVQLDPNFAEAHNNLGFCLLQTGHVPEAVAQFQKAVDLDPQSANYRCGLGNALLKGGNGNDAVAEYQKAVELAPTLAGAYYDLGSGLLQIGRIDDAIVQYQKAVELKPNSATYHLKLADALSQKGRADEAATEYRKAVELNPSLASKPGK